MKSETITEEEDCVPDWLASFVADTDRRLEEAQSKLLADDKSTVYSCTDSIGSALTNLTLRTLVMKEDEEDLKLKEKIYNNSNTINVTPKYGNNKIIATESLLVKESDNISKVDEDTLSNLQRREPSTPDASPESKHDSTAHILPDNLSELQPSLKEKEIKNTSEIDSNFDRDFSPQKNESQEAPQLSTKITCDDSDDKTNEVHIRYSYNSNLCINDGNVTLAKMNSGNKNSTVSEPSVQDLSPQILEDESLVHEVGFWEEESHSQSSNIIVQTSTGYEISPQYSDKIIEISGNPLESSKEDEVCGLIELANALIPEVSEETTKSILHTERKNEEAHHSYENESLHHVDVTYKPGVNIEIKVDTSNLSTKVTNGLNSEIQNGDVMSSLLTEGIADNSKCNDEVKVVEEKEHSCVNELNSFASEKANDDTSKKEMKFKEEDLNNNVLDYLDDCASKLQTKNEKEDVVGTAVSTACDKEIKDTIVESAKTCGEDILETELNENSRDDYATHLSSNVGSCEVIDGNSAVNPIDVQNSNYGNKVPTLIPVNQITSNKDVDKENQLSASSSGFSVDTQNSEKDSHVDQKTDSPLPGSDSNLKEHHVLVDSKMVEVEGLEIVVNTEVNTKLHTLNDSPIKTSIQAMQSSESNDKLQNLEDEQDSPDPSAKNNVAATATEVDKARRISENESQKFDEKIEADVISPISNTLFFQHLKNGFLLRSIVVILYITFLFATSKSRGLDVRILNQQSKIKGIKLWKIKVKNRDYAHGTQPSRHRTK